MSGPASTYALLLGLGALSSLALALYGWRRSVPGAGAFSVFNLGVAVWMGVYALEVGSTGPAALFWANMAYFGIVVVPASWLVFALRFSGHGQRVTTMVLTLLCIVPLATLLLAWTNPWHELFRRGVHVTPIWEPGPAFWLHTIYSYALVLAGTLLVARRATAGPRLWRGQAGVLLIAAFAPWTTNAMYLAGLSPFGNLDPSPFGFGLTSLAVAWGLFRERLLDLVPVARDAVLEGITDGVIALDSSWRVVDMNPAAEGLLGRSAAHAVGQPFKTVLANVPEVVGEAGETVLGEPPAQRWIAYRLSALPEASGGPSGSVVVLRDVTQSKRAEAAVRETERRYRELVAATPGIVWRADAQTLRFSFVSAQAEVLLGYPVERWLSEPTFWQDHIHPEDRAGAVDYCIQSAAKLREFELEYRMIAKDGSDVALRDLVHVITEDGRPRELVGVMIDITERDRAEREARESRERLELVLWGADLGYWDWSLLTGEVVRNERSAQMLGYTLAEIAPQLTAWEDLVHPEDRARVIESVRGLAQGQLGQYALEYRARAKSGDWRWVLDSGRVVARDAEGRPTRASGIQADITDHKRMEQALQEAAGFLKGVVDTSPNMIFVIDERRKVLFVNEYAAQYYGATPEQIIARSTSEIHTEPQQAGAFESDDLAVIRTRQKIVKDEQNTAPDGKLHWFHTVKVPLVRPDGSIACLGIATDITERKRAEQALRHVETLAAVGSVVAGVAHEVRNPLFGISSTLDAFEARFGSHTEFQRYLGVLRHEVERMIELMRDLLELAKPADSERRPESIVAIVEQAVQTCAPLALRANVRIALELRPGLPCVPAERSRLVQVIQNLIANAVQHSQSGSTVTVGACWTMRHGEPRVECTIADEGPGFASDDLPQVFEPFFTRRPGGTGLGLAIVRRIVEQHGGEVAAGNRPSGGALVTIRLPAAAA